MKDCIACGVSLDAFNSKEYNLRHSKYKCNDCIRKERQIYIKEKREEKSYAITYTASRMASSAKRRANVNNLPYDIDIDYLRSICVDSCPIMKKKLKYGKGELGKYSASLDRIIPELGYIKGNVQVVSNIANMMKSNASEEELELFSEWIKKD